MTLRPYALLAAALLLSGCDLEALLADPKVAQRAAEAKAIGSACRHGNRSIEDCYALNEKASKAAVFDGWKEMDQYMRDNKLEGIEPKGLKPPSEKSDMIDEKESDAAPKEKGADHGGDKADAKPKAKAKADKAGH